MSNETKDTAWLVWLGNEELRLVGEYGWDHPAVIRAQQRFRDAFLAVKAIRKAYDGPSAEKNNG